MIEQPQIPGDRIVAGATVIIEATVVGVIFGVAVCAVTVCTNEYRRFMTRIAFEIVVLAEQWETGQVVDEQRRFLPGFFSVAVIALVALFAVMNFIFKVAGCTGCTR